MPETSYDRSLTLLRKHLTPEQLRTFEVTNGFMCTGSRSKHRYYIRYGKKVVDQSGIEYCIISKSYEPIPELDVMLAKKLLIETDERTFLETAIPDRWTAEYAAFRRRQRRSTDFWMCFNRGLISLMIVYGFYIFLR